MIANLNNRFRVTISFLSRRGCSTLEFVESDMASVCFVCLHSMNNDHSVAYTISSSKQ